MKKSKNTFVCSEKCLNFPLPFFYCNDIDFFSAIFGEGLYPCSKCKRDCLDHMACIRCSVCNTWCHHVCSGLTNDQFRSNYYFFCNSKCENFNVTFLPFSKCKDSELFGNEIFVKPNLDKIAAPISKGRFVQPEMNTDNFMKQDHF